MVTTLLKIVVRTLGTPQLKKSVGAVTLRGDEVGEKMPRGLSRLEGKKLDSLFHAHGRKIGPAWNAIVIDLLVVFLCFLQPLRDLSLVFY